MGERKGNRERKVILRRKNGKEKKRELKIEDVKAGWLLWEVCSWRFHPNPKYMYIYMNL